MGERVIITYDGVPSYSVSIMEFANEQVVHETQYFADPFHFARVAGSPRGADAGQEHCQGLTSVRSGAGRARHR